MSTAETFVPPYFDQFSDPKLWGYVTSLAAEFPAIDDSELKKRGGDPTDSGLLGFIHHQTGVFQIPVVQLEEDGFTVQPEVLQMMDLMHRRGANAIQIALWWFEPKDHFGGISPAAHLEVSSNRNRILMSTMQADGPYHWTVPK